ncbi:MAG: Gfo/Idh/MocA family oxidoreductase [Bacteroidales bacterium]|nr:Gfo/Idh/MocA family oxidoreductase [Bacteroidales bacterium]
MDRRNFLKSCGLIAAGSAMAGPLAHAGSLFEEPLALPDGAEPLKGLNLPIRSLEPKTDRQISVIIIGCGNRGNTYARFAESYPKAVKIVGVSDILEHRRTRLGDIHGVKPEMRFGDFSEVFASGKKLADAVVISTPDDRHYKPCMMALALGYDVLLEKPIAQTEKECKDIGDLARRNGRIVAVCHVLRYAPYFLALREAVRSGLIGDLVSIQHMEPIQYAHMAHSYVRGNWRDSKETTPIILAKSCHDLDILRWIVDRPCKQIVADGDLYFFKAENAPKDAPMRCTDGCPHADTCPYNAIDIYTRQKAHLGVFDLDGNYDPDFILSRLKDPRYNSYARCVFHCDNDQPDHYVTNMVFEGGITASFTMDAFSPFGGRRTRVMGTMGFIEGDMTQFTYWDFLTRKPKYWNEEVAEVPEYAGSGHGGGDYGLMRDFVEAVAAQDASQLSSTVDVSIESHVMGFAAERSRISGRKETV